MQAQSTTEKPVNIEVWAKWFKFETFNDPQLIAILEAGARFVRSIKNGEAPHWLSLVGTSGAGKTFLAKRIHRWVRECSELKAECRNGELIYGDDYVSWPDLAKALQANGGREWIHEITRTKFVTLDDIGAVRDTSGFVTGELSVLLGQRVGKWTVITSNLNLEQISERVDNRVASRMIRDGNVVIDVDVLDFSLRRQRPAQRSSWLEKTLPASDRN